MPFWNFVALFTRNGCNLHRSCIRRTHSATAYLFQLNDTFPAVTSVWRPMNSRRNVGDFLRLQHQPRSDQKRLPPAPRIRCQVLEHSNRPFGSYGRFKWWFAFASYSLIYEFMIDSFYWSSFCIITLVNDLFVKIILAMFIESIIFWSCWLSIY